MKKILKTKMLTIRVTARTLMMLKILAEEKQVSQSDLITNLIVLAGEEAGAVHAAACTWVNRREGE